MTHQEIRPETFHDSDTFYPAVIWVTTREELTKALRERTAQLSSGTRSWRGRSSVFCGHRNCGGGTSGR
jgi:hypothetical protein